MAEIVEIKDDMLSESGLWKTQYLDTLVNGRPFVLCMESAAEMLALYSGTFDNTAYVYKQEDCDKEEIEYIDKHGCKITTPEQTLTDLLNNDEADIQALIETLASVYDKESKGHISLHKLTDLGEKRLKEYKGLSRDYFYSF